MIAPDMPALRRLRRFFRSPKGYLLLALAALCALAAPSVGASNALRTLIAAVVGAAGLELLIVRSGEGAWRFPSSALLSGLIVGMVLGAQEPWFVAMSAGLVATNAKHVLRLGRAHVFNPAALGLLVVFALFGTGQSWWGALPELPLPAVAVLIVAGYLVADRANKLPAALAFLGAYTVMFTAASFGVAPGYVGDIFRTPFLHMALFFAFFMVTDPPTSPVTFGEQIWFGVAVATVSYLTYMATRGLYFLLVGVLVGNALYAVWRTVRRQIQRGSQAQAAPAAQPARVAVTAAPLHAVTSGSPDSRYLPQTAQRDTQYVPPTSAASPIPFRPGGQRFPPRGSG